MNLAEIRKKAKRERSGSPAPVVTEENVVSGPKAEQFNPTTSEEWPFPDEQQVLPSCEELAYSVPSPSSVCDPLTLILAGREMVAEDEQGEATGEEATASTGVFQELLCFRVSSEKYAINIMEIKEIIKPREITEVPRVPPFVSGVLSLRGIIIPIFNMRKRLGLVPLQESRKERIIVIKKGEEYCGVLVDEVIQVVRIAATSIEHPPAVLDGIDKEFVSGIGRYDGMMLILLNLEKILDVNLS